MSLNLRFEETMDRTSDEQIIAKIAQREFGRSPDSVTRMTNGICNDVYTVTVGDREYIFRLKDEPRYLLGSSKHIPLFRSKGIQVPEILAEDYSRSWLPVAFQIQSKLPGRDIGEVIATLSDEELKSIGAQVANVFRELAPVPNNGKFGVVWGDENGLVDSWAAEVQRVTRVVKDWGRKTGVLDAKLEKTLDRINAEYRSYFDRIRPYTYYGDIAGKNVMVHEGRFSGLVDLDAIAQGDPLEAVGRIKASWYGTHYGTVYADAVMDALGLPEPQRRIVTMYALLNRTFWTLENGVQFNQNTNATVDRIREAEDKRVVNALYLELFGEEVQPVVEMPQPIQVNRPEPDAIAAEPSHVIEEEEEIPIISISEPPAPVPEPEPVLGEPSKPVRRTRRKPVAEIPYEESATQADAVPILEVPETKVADTPEPSIEPEPASPPVIAVEKLSDAETAAVAAETEPPPHQEVSMPHTVSNPSSRAVLDASAITKTYVSGGTGFNALTNVDLKIGKGECVAIIGKSGSGKSTLMHLLACLDEPTEGYVYVDGDDTTTMSEPEKNRLRNESFGFVFQQFFLNGRDTVYENVALPLRIRGMSEAEIGLEAESALAAVGLSDHIDKKAKDLSGGEKQRVCIARALINRPKVIFADEPTGNLDSATGEAVERLLFELNKEKGITLVVVTHDPELAAKCSRVVELKDGRIIRDTAVAAVGAGR